MGKKYLDVKKNSLEDSILGVWKTAAEEADIKIDGRTRGYRTHRERLETRRAKREEKKTTAKEAVETESYEMGTDEYREYLERLTPGEVREEIAKLDSLIEELEEGILGNIAKAAGKSIAKGAKGVAKKAYGAVKKKVGGSVVGKAYGKVKSGVKKAKAIGKKIKTAAKTGKAYGDEYSPMLKRLEAVEFKLNEYCQVLEEEMASEYDSTINEGSKEEYEKFFNAAMKKFKINSPSDLKSDEEKKKFFDYIDKNYTKEEEKIQLAREFKVSSMREALAKVWGLNEKSAKYLELEFKDSTTAANAYSYINNKIEPGGRQPWDDFNQEGSSIQFENMKDADSLMKELKRKFKFKVYEREEKDENRGKTLTGKRAAAVEIDPEPDLEKK